MRKFFATVSTGLLILLAAGGGIALAAELEVVPLPISEGEQELTISVWDFDPDSPIFVLPCDYPATGDAADVTTDTCSIAEVATGSTDADGRASFDVTWQIPADGIGIFASDELRQEVVTRVLEVDGDVEVLGTSTTADDELADTGAETVPLISLGVGLLALGGASLRTSRKLTPLTI